MPGMSTGRVSAAEIRRRLDRHARRQRLWRINQGVQVMSEKVDMGVQTDDVSDRDLEWETLVKFLKSHIRRLEKERKYYKRLVQEYLSD